MFSRCRMICYAADTVRVGALLRTALRVAAPYIAFAKRTLYAAPVPRLSCTRQSSQGSAPSTSVAHDASRAEDVMRCDVQWQMHTSDCPLLADKTSKISSLSPRFRRPGR